MERFLKKRRTSVEDQDVDPSQEHNDAPSHDSHEPDDAPDPPSPHGENDSSTEEENYSDDVGNSSLAPEEINWEEEIEFDPGKRRSIDEYPPNLKDMVRRKYLANGPCQPRTTDFPVTVLCGKDRRFVSAWFEE